MAENTEIAWCDSTFNPWIGCTKVGPGCDHCYAEADFDHRKHRAKWGAGQPRSRTSAANWKKPLQWNAKPFYECPGCGWRGDDPHDRPRCPTCDQTHMLKQTRRRVFCASLGDVFDNEVPADWRRDLFDLIELTPNLDWLLLTKRVGNVQRMVREVRSGDWLAGQRNVWIGATICNQTEANRDIPKLLAVPARVRFLSIEPMLGLIDFYQTSASMQNHGHPWANGPILGGIHWVVSGGESGPKARPMHPDWARSLRDQCAAASVPFLFKQWGEHDLSYDRDRDDPDYRRCDRMTKLPGRWINLAGGHGFNGERVHYAHRVGKKASGRLLDGMLHHAFPEGA